MAGALLDPLCPPEAKTCQRGRIGLVAPNAFADLIALAKPRFVMKAGGVFQGP